MFSKGASGERRIRELKLSAHLICFTSYTETKTKYDLVIFLWTKSMTIDFTAKINSHESQHNCLGMKCLWLEAINLNSSLIGFQIKLWNRSVMPYLDDCFCLFWARRIASWCFLAFSNVTTRLWRNSSRLKHLCVIHIHFSRGIRLRAPFEYFKQRDS